MFYHGWIRASDCVCRGVWSCPVRIYGSPLLCGILYKYQFNRLQIFKKRIVLTLSVKRGRNVNALQRRHPGPELLSQSRCRENIPSARLRLLFSHPGGQIHNGYWVGMSRKILTFAFSSATSFCNDSISSMKMTWQHQFGKKGLLWPGCSLPFQNWRWTWCVGWCSPQGQLCARWSLSQGTSHRGCLAGKKRNFSYLPALREDFENATKKHKSPQAPEKCSDWWQLQGKIGFGEKAPSLLLCRQTERVLVISIRTWVKLQ